MRSLSFGAALCMATGMAVSPSVHHVTIVATDYAFNVPDQPLAHGVTEFTFENHGAVRHEMNLVRLKPGVTLDSALHAAPGPARRALVEGGGVLFAEPGARSPYQLLVDLTAGRTYVLLCTFQDAPDKPAHLALGMFAGFQVR